MSDLLGSTPRRPGWRRHAVWAGVLAVLCLVGAIVGCVLPQEKSATGSAQAGVTSAQVSEVAADLQASMSVAAHGFIERAPACRGKGPNDAAPSMVTALPQRDSAQQLPTVLRVKRPTMDPPWLCASGDEYGQVAQRQAPAPHLTTVLRI